ncbi:hypothetical protein B0F90DRAFT_1760492 [Multifurca ochricompacta]|uniref:Phytochrome n=1 Tax=Multifurca ochricompacta TaxID=376703 RepID=A0AAD4LXP0_9AGAM|nr:hypothetical protein B0F90DRAFT_1760492 [Multifurca ochricompacta]
MTMSEATSPIGDSSSVGEPDSPSFHAGSSPQPIESNSPRPSSFTQVTNDVLSSAEANLDLYPRITQRSQPVATVDMSDTGIVHLPPRSSSRSTHSHSSLALGGSQSASELHCITGHSSHTPSQLSVSTPSSQYESLPSPHGSASDNSGPSLAGIPEGSLAPLQSSSSSSADGSPVQRGTGRSVGSSNGSYAQSDEPPVTFRFEHREDGDGHHVVIGREGKLMRCEDEPIRTPGSVQGFGVLIAVQEDAKDEQLLVRHVSENSTELLGLSPRYLFSLPCFTDVLPEPQAGILWDNIQYLNDLDDDSHSEDDSPHVFMLSGWGMPGTAMLGDGDDDPYRRRSWSCWCAAHRPKMTGPESRHGVHDLIILEFELEHDVFNPLFPSTVPIQDQDLLSGLSSPESNGSTSTSTSGTLVSPPISAATKDFKSVMGATAPSITFTPSAEESTSSTSSFSNITARTSPQSLLYGIEGTDDWRPSAEDILESTMNHAKPLPALERIRSKMNQAAASVGTESGASRLPAATGGPVASGSGHSVSTARTRRGKQRGRSEGGVGMMDIFALMAQINEQLGAATDLDFFLKIVVGLIKDLTQFHRVLVYQFDESWNGQVVAELVDWNRTHDLYRGLHFPESDIPAQVCSVRCNKIRLLYDREQVTARLVVRSKEDLDVPLVRMSIFLIPRSRFQNHAADLCDIQNMTHCYLRAMSPIHLQCTSIFAFGQLWGLVACHSYGPKGMRVSFPVRQMLRLMSDSISRNVERLSYAQRLHTRKLVWLHCLNASDLLGIFDADFGVLVIGEGAKILGPNEHGQEVLVHFETIQVSHAVTKDFPDLRLSTGLEIIAGLLYVPLSQGGTDFIALLRKGQLLAVRWAGNPYKESSSTSGAGVGMGADADAGAGASAGEVEDGVQRGGSGVVASLEPRTSFKVWSETVIGRCRAWTDEQLETASVLALVYGKFIEVWREREKERTLQTTTKLTNILLSNAGHEVRTPLNHIINCLELALNGKLDVETRENLSQSHAASKSLLFTINDLLDLTRLESGHETTSNEPFDLPSVITEATNLYKHEAQRKGLDFELNLSDNPHMVVGDSSKVRTVVANITANALKYTQRGSITVSCRAFNKPEYIRSSKQVAVEIVVGDTGCGIPPSKLENIFREFEQVESVQPKTSTAPGLGLGLAVVARSVEQLGGQLRVDSKIDQGSRFSFLIPFMLWDDENVHVRHHEAYHLLPNLLLHPYQAPRTRHRRLWLVQTPPPEPKPRHASLSRRKRKKSALSADWTGTAATSSGSPVQNSSGNNKLRILSVEVTYDQDNDVNRLILAKRLQSDGHTVVNTTNGKEGVEMIEADQAFDCVLMDVQMPILNGLDATRRIRDLEATKLAKTDRLAHTLNGARIPIFAVSASLVERQREELEQIGIDGWILKPIDFQRLYTILRGVTDPAQRVRDEYHPGGNWEIGGWLLRHQPASASAPPLLRPDE